MLHNIVCGWVDSYVYIVQPLSGNFVSCEKITIQKSGSKGRFEDAILIRYNITDFLKRSYIGRRDGALLFNAK